MAESLKKHQLALFGHPVAHSLSPKIHTEFAKQFDIQLTYQLIDAIDAELPKKFNEWIKHALGCNVTVPHKKNIIPLLDHYTEKAHLAQAVNTVYWHQGKLWGDNTDGDGLVLDLKNKGVEISGKNILIIGAGGAAQGIIPSLLQHDASHIDITNRNRERADLLAVQFNSSRISAAGHKMPYEYDLIIHATSMGHMGLAPELTVHNFHADTITYDLSYGSAAEPFLEACKSMGVKQSYDGLGMLYGQAALAFEIWFGEKPAIKLFD